MAERSEANSARMSFASMIRIFDAKICFAVLASLRLAMFRKFQGDNFLVNLHERVNQLIYLFCRFLNLLLGNVRFII